MSQSNHDFLDAVSKSWISHIRFRLPSVHAVSAGYLGGMGPGSLGSGDCTSGRRVDTPGEGWPGGAKLSMEGKAS